MKNSTEMAGDPGYINQQMLSSLPLQIFVHVFYYPPSAFQWEISMTFFLTFIDATRQTLASRGNKTEQLKPLLWSIGLSVPVVVGYTFFLHLQTYVVRSDLILNSISLVLVSFTFLCSVYTAITFYAANNFI